MSGLRYVGPSPDRQTSIVRNSHVNDRLKTSQGGLVDPVIQAQNRGALYATLSDLNSRKSGYVTTDQATTESNLYIRSSDINKNISGLTDGKIPSTLLPLGAGPYLEPLGYSVKVPAYSGSSPAYIYSTISTVTVNYPGYTWSPFVSIVLEVSNGDSETRSGFRVLDASGTVVAQGESSVGPTSQSVAVSTTSSLPKYTVSQQFRIQATVLDGTTSMTVTAGYGGGVILPVPA